MGIFSDILQKANEAKSLVDLIISIAQDLEDGSKPKPKPPTPPPMPPPPPKPPEPEPEPVEPDEPTNPEEPTEPVEPDPIEPTEPEEPTEPTEPTKPEEPTTPPEEILYFPIGDAVVKDTVFLHPQIQESFKKALQSCQENGYDVILCETYRTAQRQENLYALGRSKQGNIVTYAKAYQSYHNYGLAIDLTTKDGKGINESVAAILEGCGFEWGGRWKTFKDYPHFQMSFGRSIPQIQDLYQEGGMELVWNT